MITSNPHPQRHSTTPAVDVSSRCATLSVGGRPAYPIDPGGTHIWDPGGGAPSWMVASCLGPFDSRPVGLFEKTAEALQLEDWYRVQALPFTAAEWAFLTSSDPDPELIIEQIIESSDTQKKIVFKVDGVANRTRPPRAPCDLPLGAITSHRIDYEALFALPIAATPELHDALSWILTDRLKKYVMAHPLFEETRKKNGYHVSRHMMDDMLPLHDTGIFALNPWGEASIEVPLFKVPKAGAIESRLIGDCRSVNSLLPKAGPMGLPPLRELIRDLLRHRYLYQLDAKSYFYHFGMGADTCEVFSSRWGNKRGHFFTSSWRVMPMGYLNAPRIGQQTALHVCANVVQKGGTMIPWIDNFLFGSDTPPVMESMQRKFAEVTRFVNIECKKEAMPYGHTMEAIGLHFDVSAEDANDHFGPLIHSKLFRGSGADFFFRFLKTMEKCLKSTFFFMFDK